MTPFETPRGAGRIVAVLGLIATTGCAHVNEEQLAAEMDVLREEMRTGDQGVENRLTERMGEIEDDMDARIAQLERDLRELSDEFDVTVERMEAAVRFNTPVHFAFDEAAILPENRALLERFASIVGQYYDDAVLTVEGFADPSGSEQYNMELGRRRADAVRDFLVAAGIPAARVRAVSYGEAPERQIAPDAQGPGDDGWQNRRAAIVVDFNGEVAGEPAV